MRYKCDHLWPRLLLAALLAVSGSAMAQEMGGEYWLSKGNSAYDRGYYDVAAGYYLKAAQYKLVDAQLYLGYAFYTGEGMDKDYASAVMWYKRAVAQGSHKAQYNLAYCYMQGNGVPASYDKALELLTAAAEGDYEPAQRTLAECYQKGVLVEQDEAKGAYWLKRAEANAKEGTAVATEARSKAAEKAEETPNKAPEKTEKVAVKAETKDQKAEEPAADEKKDEGELQISFADDVELEFADGTKKEAVEPAPAATAQNVEEPVEEAPSTEQAAAEAKPRVVVSPRMQQKLEAEQAAAPKPAQPEAQQPQQAAAPQPSAAALAPVVKILYPEDQSMFHTDRLPVMYQLIANGLEAETKLTVLVDGVEQPATRAVKKPNLVEVELPNHDCTVMMYAQNKNGNSIPATIRLIRENVVEQDLPRLFAVCIGVGEYDDPDLPNLKFTTKDATDFANALMSKKGLPYSDIQVKTLCDGEATRGDIFEALEWLRQETRPTDVCIFYYAGHGIRDEKDRFYFMPYGSSPRRLWDCFSADEFRKMAEDIDGKFIVFVDACYSAALFDGGRSAAVNHFIEQLRRTKNGMMFYASSASDTKSKEGENWKNGAFTKALVEAFHGAARRTPDDEGLTTHDLENYVYTEVKKITESRQTPIFKNVGGLEHFTLFIYE